MRAIQVSKLINGITLFILILISLWMWLHYDIFVELCSTNNWNYKFGSVIGLEKPQTDKMRGKGERQSALSSDNNYSAFIRLLDAKIDQKPLKR